MSCLFIFCGVITPKRRAHLKVLVSSGTKVAAGELVDTFTWSMDENAPKLEVSRLAGGWFGKNTWVYGTPGLNGGGET